MISVILQCEGLAQSPGLCRENEEKEKKELAGKVILKVSGQALNGRVLDQQNSYFLLFPQLLVNTQKASL